MFGMDKQLTFVILLVTIFGLGIFVWFLYVKGIDVSKVQINSLKKEGNNLTTTGNMKITSSAFQNGGDIPVKYSCNGENINPEFAITGVPTQAKSLLLILEDPDAPFGTFTHWIVYNINPTTTLIPANNYTEKAQLAQNDLGKLEYTGPCPPTGKHRYNFKLFALDTLLDVPAGAGKNKVAELAKPHIIDAALLTGLFAK